MPIGLVLLGLMMIVSGAKDTYQELGAALVEDFTGPGNFTWWIAGLGTIGAIGYYKPLQGFSRLFLVLVILSMLLSNQGFFAKLTGSLNAGPDHPKAAEPTNPAAQTAGHAGSLAGLNAPDNSLWNAALQLGPGSSVTAPSAPQAPKSIGDFVNMVAAFSKFILPIVAV